MRHPRLHAAAILVVGFLAYANTFDVPFVLDDLESIVNNETIRSLGNFLPDGSGYDFHFRRTLVYFTFALNYHFGGYSVFGYHLFNLAVHLGTALLLYQLLLQTFRTPVFAGSRLVPFAGTAALLAALFFVAHPIQTQAVTYVVQRLASLCTFFYILALACYIDARLRLDALTQAGKKGSADPLAMLLLSAAVGSSILAMFCKEIALTLPLAVLLYEFSFFRGPWRRRFIVLLPILATLAVIPLNTLIPDEGIQESVQMQVHNDTAPLHYLFTQFRVIVTYLRLLFLPIGQNLDYDYPVYTTLATPPVFLSFLLLAALLTFAGWLFLKAGKQESGISPLPFPEYRLIAFGIFWFFLTLAVESSLVPLADVIFEHRLYLPMVGVSAALAVGIALAMQSSTSLAAGRLPLLAAAAGIIALGIGTWQRNQAWQSELTLWEDTARKSPAKVRPLYNLGTYYGDNGRAVEAVQTLSQVVAMDPQHADAWHNLGRAYLLLGRSQEAVPALQAAVRLKPNLANAVLNLASALIQNRQYGEAISFLEGERQRNPEWPDLHYNLGLAYLGHRNLPAASRELAVLSSSAPNLARPLADLIKRASGNLPQ